MTLSPLKPLCALLVEEAGTYNLQVSVRDIEFYLNKTAQGSIFFKGEHSISILHYYAIWIIDMLEMRIDTISAQLKPISIYIVLAQ